MCQLMAYCPNLGIELSFLQKKTGPVFIIVYVDDKMFVCAKKYREECNGCFCYAFFIGKPEGYFSVYQFRIKGERNQAL